MNGVMKVVSGGQTGVDRAALDAAIEAGLECGGWCPAGRRAEDGEIPEHYPLLETEGPSYIERTQRNVDDSDGTLIITRGAPSGGTKRTIEHAKRVGKPFLIVDLRKAGEEAFSDHGDVAGWIEAHGIATLNVAGPRESTRPGIHGIAKALLRSLLRG